MDLLAIQYLVAILSAITGFFLALKPVRRLLLKIWQKTFGRRGQVMDEILRELKPNGNSSMRDAIDRIEDRQYDFDAFLAATLNTEKDAIFRTDSQGLLYTINRAHQRLLGYSLAEMEGQGWKNCVHPDNRAKVVKQWEDSVSAKTELNEDIKFIHANGDTMLLHASVFREIDARGKIRGYLGVISHLNDPTVCPHLGVCIAHESIAKQEDFISFSESLLKPQEAEKTSK